MALTRLVDPAFGAFLFVTSQLCLQLPPHPQSPQVDQPGVIAFAQCFVDRSDHVVN